MFFFMILLSLFFVQQAGAHPLLTVVIMVKNEENFIIPTLLPFFEGGVDNFLVLDTGSTDKTVAVVQQFFASHPSIKGYIFEEPFIDFAASRNKALQLADLHFPEIPFFFMPDAEWYIHNVQGLLNFCLHELHTKTLTYLIKIRIEHKNHYQARLIRAHSGVTFIGKIHEILEGERHAKIPDTTYITFFPSLKGLQKSKERWRQDKKILMQEYLQDPGNSRTVFYLAQTYECLEEWCKALKYYIVRTHMRGWQEEKYMANYRAACLLHYYFNDWDRAFYYYIQSYVHDARRAEPLIHIAHHFLIGNNIYRAYIYAKEACGMPYPADNILFIDDYLYNTVRHHIFNAIVDAIVQKIMRLPAQVGIHCIDECQRQC